jgi:antitoxin (DNA-binding transcriptional repressor) of toxin-antitoxin stability system
VGFHLSGVAFIQFRLDQTWSTYEHQAGMRHVNLYEAKTQLSKLVSAVEEQGEAIVLCRNGRPVADLVPHQESSLNLKADKRLSGARFKGDPCASLSEDDWPEALR